MNRLLWTVFRKEVIDHLRDRRSVLNTFVTLALIGPLIFGVTFKAIEAQINRAESLRVPVIAAERAPALMAFLRNEGAKVEAAPADYEARLHDGGLDVVLSIPADFAEAFSSDRPAKVEMAVDESQDRAAATVARVQRLLEAYSRQIGLLRLVARGVNPDVVKVLKIETRDLARPQQQGAGLLKLVVGYGLFAAFVGATSIMTDATAGERERGSLEPLLINPVAPSQLLAGKWLAGSVFSVLAVLTTLLGYVASLRIFPFHTLGISLRFGLRELCSAALTLVPACFLSAALLSLVGLFARTFKEAQVSASVLIFLVMLPSILLIFKPMKVGLPAMFVPLLSQNLILGDLIRGETIAPLHALVAAGTTVAVGALCAFIAGRLIVREKIVFGR
jgi:sodium transport system permease protein